MLTWLIWGAIVYAIAKAADMEGRSGIIWGALTFLLLVACAVLVPIPFLSPILAGVVAFVLMTVMNIVQSRERI